MSTNCRIGIENKDGTITSIYCHHDGYMEGGVGERLVVHYTDEAKIKKLMELGDLSSLGTEPVENPNAWKTPSSQGLFTGTKSWIKIFRELHPEDKCDAYRTRGETCPAKIHKDMKDYGEAARKQHSYYVYLFKDNKWYDLDSGNLVDVAAEIDKGE